MYNKIKSSTIRVIITILLFSGILNTALALDGYTEGYIDKLLDINYGVEEYNLEMADIEDVYFYTQSYRNMFEEFKNVNKVLKNEIIIKYRDGYFGYYRVNGIISNYKKFVYYTNNFFYYVSIKERNPSFKEADIAIIKNYRKMRTYYERVKILTNKNGKKYKKL